jgi:hypothetical protein
MEKIRVVLFFALFLLFVGALAFFQNERYGNITGLGSRDGNDKVAEPKQGGTFYQVFYFVFLGVLLVVAIRFIFKHREIVQRLRQKPEKDFERRLIKIDLSEDY